MWSWAFINTVNVDGVKLICFVTKLALGFDFALLFYDVFELFTGYGSERISKSLFAAGALEANMFTGEQPNIFFMEQAA